MYSTKMVTFRKYSKCPSSQDLLAFGCGQISDERCESISLHVKSCEFCDTEVEFYARYPQTEEKVKTAEIPAPLYELAEALLNNKCEDFSGLDKLFNKNKELELKKV